MTKMPELSIERRLDLDLRSADDGHGAVGTIATGNVVHYVGGVKEKLIISPETVDLSRMEKGGVPILFNHNRDMVIGTLELAWFEEGRLRAELRITDLETRELVKDGVLKSLSIGYLPLKSDRRTLNGEDVVVVSKLELLEVSLVTVPRDPDCAIGRSQNENNGAFKMNDIEVTAVDPQVEKAMKEERSRAENINAIGAHYGYGDMATRAIADGLTVADFTAKVREKGHKPASIQTMNELGLSKREMGEFSLLRGLDALAEGKPEKAPLEFEATRAMEQETGRDYKGIAVPPELVTRDVTMTLSGHTGDKLKDDVLMTGMYSDVLRDRMVLRDAGARYLTGLVGNASIPKATTDVTGYWVDEDGQITESTPAFTTIDLEPHTLGVNVDVTRRTLKQTAMDFEALVLDMILSQLDLSVQTAAFHGTGNNDPLGLAALAGVNDVVMGTDGDHLDWYNIVKFESVVNAANGDLGTMAYITNSKVRASLKTTSKWANTDSPIWADSNSIGGHKALTTNAIASTLDKGNSTGVCSAMFFGVWSQMVIGMWGGIDVIVDRNTFSDRGKVRLVAFQDCDVKVIHPEAFARSLDVLTSTPAT